MHAFSRREARGRAAIVVALALVLAITLLPPTPAAAQQPEPTSEADTTADRGGRDLSDATIEAAEATPVGGASRDTTVTSDKFTPGDSPTGLWIVTLEDEPAATYRGGVEGFAPTAVNADRGERLDTDAPEVVAYEGHLQRQQTQVRRQIGRELGRIAALSHTYVRAANGFALEMSEAEARRVASLPGVRRVVPDELLELQSDAGPEWINALTYDTNSDGDLVVTPTPDIGTLGEGMVVGIIDGGISPTSPSFAETVPVEDGGDGYEHTWAAEVGYYGVCDVDAVEGDPLTHPTPSATTSSSARGTS